MRCLPAAKLSLAQGRCLHDWHAEIVAIRAFNHHLLRQCLRMAQNPAESCNILQRTANDPDAHSARPFTIRNDVQLHMYCSEAPCGDASMELIMDAQDDATPWEVPEKLPGEQDSLSGRGNFSMLGRVRRKPARADAPVTLSKSCSDKLAIRQCTSLLLSLTSLFVNVQGAYLTDLVLPTSRHSRVATERAFSGTGRMAGLVQKQAMPTPWKDGYAFRPFKIEETSCNFSFQRSGPGEAKAMPSNIAAVWTEGLQEVVIGGTIQGYKQFAERGASSISRVKLCELSLDLASCLHNDQLSSLLRDSDYATMKACNVLESRRKVKDDVRQIALQPWIINSGDDSFRLDD